MAGGSKLRLAESLMLSKSLDKFTDADTALIEEAVVAIERDIARDSGLTEAEFRLLTFFMDNSDDKHSLITDYALKIIGGRKRDKYSQWDKDLIHSAAKSLSDTLQAQGKLPKDASRSEQKIYVADETLNPRYAESTANAASSIVSHSPSMLATLESLANIPNIMGSGGLSDLNSYDAGRIAAFMKAHPDRFEQPAPLTVTGPPKERTPRGRLPPGPQFPQLPSYAECRLEDLPDTIADIDAEIDLRLNHQAEISEYLIRNSGVLWRLKMKRNML
ncbi:uncharacterized protein NECHADRAFT_89040 [Fusarium vanettenii 77-13-4]|uniref:Uncharacterized protein n=1 Tax=Fusarium vanettenii (strain ATCC MYA-4622 / CBS 123669 / FGSC 9596 / NRRL 45880 / 77-13-4) TaxID=660122 RepID=C7ZPZ5_FUSV7|nr:uncharacterized protein NECHADRAFT_89040 [Fusarium vanettenii 77-13-4]EEU33906.1 predicted protein [Fusarium vanettenii 77-13-4]